MWQDNQPLTVEKLKKLEDNARVLIQDLGENAKLLRTLMPKQDGKEGK